uniref:Uncharacterized protein n=1 Tax=Oryza sativa subsp. japonica TaxID=39947 RepID=Q6K6B2_ORYSJ|nr:hypothetical protein [Oryza sativa Japonica Group]
MQHACLLVSQASRSPGNSIGTHAYPSDDMSIGFDVVCQSTATASETGSQEAMQIGVYAMDGPDGRCCSFRLPASAARIHERTATAQRLTGTARIVRAR